MVVQPNSEEMILWKIALIGPAGSGKTTLIEELLRRIPEQYHSDFVWETRGSDELCSVDLFPANLPLIDEKKLHLRLITTSGKIESDETYRHILEEIDGVVFVASSLVGMMVENVRIAELIEELLNHSGRSLRQLPLVMAYNHRDGDNLYTPQELEAKLNGSSAPAFEMVAKKGQGVFLVVKSIVEQLLEMWLPEETENESQDGECFQLAPEDQAEGQSDDAGFRFPDTHVDYSSFSVPTSGEGEGEHENGIWQRLATRFKRNGEEEGE